MGDGENPGTNDRAGFIKEVRTAEENAFRDYLQCYATYDEANNAHDRYSRASFPQEVKDDSRQRWSTIHGLMVSAVLDNIDIVAVDYDEDTPEQVAPAG